MRLALVVGCTLDELGQRMTAHEFGLWSALWAEEPWGDVRADVRAGAIAATVANYAGKQRGASAAPAQPADFMPFLQRPQDEAPEPDPAQWFSNLGQG